MKKPQDRFSGHAEIYKKFRPVYPPALYEYILRYCATKSVAWDCGTGNGQVAEELIKYFDQVYASDISAKQLAEAPSNSKVSYMVSRAEHTNFEANRFDLITVAQALHWFDFTAFNKEVERVLKPGGVLAVWGYDLLRINEVVNPIIDDFYFNKIYNYWDSERRFIENRYADISLPFTQHVVAESFSIDLKWSLSQLEGYFSSWSAVQKYEKQHSGEQPVEQLMSSIRKVYAQEYVHVQFPVFLHLRKSE